MVVSSGDGGDARERGGDGGLAVAVVAPADDGAVVLERKAVEVPCGDGGDAGEPSGDGGQAEAGVAPADDGAVVLERKAVGAPCGDGRDAGEPGGNCGALGASPADDGAVVLARKAVVASCGDGDDAAGELGGDGGLAAAVAAPTQHNRDPHIRPLCRVPLVCIQQSFPGGDDSIADLASVRRIQVHPFQHIGDAVGLEGGAVGQNETRENATIHIAGENTAAEHQRRIPIRILPEKRTQNRGIRGRILTDRQRRLTTRPAPWPCPPAKTCRSASRFWLGAFLYASPRMRPTWL